MRRFFTLISLAWALTSTCLAIADNPAWEKLTLPKEAQGRNLLGVHFVDAKQGWIVGDNGLCLATVDAGATWKLKDTRSGATLRSVRFTDAQTGWACGDGDPKAPKTGGHVVLNRPLQAGTLLHTKDGGKSWQTSWVQTNFDITWIEPAAVPLLQVGVSGGDGHLDGDITRSPDRGQNWKSSRCYRALFAVSRVDEKKWSAVGSAVAVGFFPTPTSELYTKRGCRALYSEDGGDTWKASKGSEGKGSLRSLAAAKDRALLTVGDNGVILRSTDAGATWVAVKSPATEDIRSVAWCGEVAVAVGAGGTVLLGKDDGKTWERVMTDQTLNLRGVAAAGDYVVAVGDRGAIIRLAVVKAGKQ
jgi:photosystem II stability/assembly factor-like uncharacterized protein